MKLRREQNCGELRKEHVGREVTLAGWIENVRDLGGMMFFVLRDREGRTQVSVPSDSPLLEQTKELGNQYVVAVRGKVEDRPEENVNADMATGEVEVIAEEIELLSPSAPLPMNIHEKQEGISEEMRLKYRYLDLRRQNMQDALRLRHRVTMAVRKFLDGQGFWEVETPILNKSTPEGARDYLVPSRIHANKFYALPQSPQIFKQLIMVGGVEKYYQIARCFRDEDLRADRQPEFTQIDMEMSFVEKDDVFTVTEGMFSQIFKEGIDVDIKTPFPRYTYQEVVNRFGLDKPDMRFGLELVDISELAAKTDFKVFTGTLDKGGVVKGINVSGGADDYSRKMLDGLNDFVADFGGRGVAWMKVREDKIQSPIAKFFSDEVMDELKEKMDAQVGDLLLFMAASAKVVHDSLGNLRNKLARELGLLEGKEKEYNFLWVVDFPLFAYDEEDGRYYSEHHPFTAPAEEDLEHLESDPLKVRAQSYDLVLNGVELGSGSIRIHRMDVQRKIFEILDLKDEEIEERFGFFINALQYGAPPHGGIAPGLDRIVMLLGGFKDIRDVIAFPKTNKAACLMSDSPSVVDEKQLDELHLKLIKPEKDEDKRSKLSEGKANLDKGKDKKGKKSKKGKGKDKKKKNK